MTQPNLKELAKQGDVKAIATLMNRALQPKGITAKVQLKDCCLQVMLESTQVPKQQFCVALIGEGMRRLGVSSIQSLRIFGRQRGEDFPAWTEELALNLQPNLADSLTPSSLTFPHAPTTSHQEIRPLSSQKTEKSNQFDIVPIKAGFMFLLAIYGFKGLLDYESLWFIHNFDLIIHEAGHVVFMFFGDFMHALGGTLLQLIVPIGITIYFFYHQQRYSGAVTIFWIAINLLDVARYMKDAQAQELPLLGGELVTHDWNYLFGRLNLLELEQLIGGFVHFIGFLLYVLAIAAGFYFACNTSKTQQRMG